MEIETGKSNAIENTRKCLGVGYKTVICIATNWDGLTKIKEDLGKHGLNEGVKLIFVNDFGVGW